MNKHTLRPAIAMIELIFALVIMGIVLMSAPRLISSATQSSYVSIQQEAISEAASQANMIMGYEWDEEDTNSSFLSPILIVASGHGDLNTSLTTYRRNGTPPESERASVRDDGTHDIAATTALALGKEGTLINDIDDFDDSNTSLSLVGNRAGNVETTTINIANEVHYVSDDPAAAGTGDYNQATITFNPALSTAEASSTNIKAIEVTLTSTSGVTELEKEIVLRAFTCNIGGYELEPQPF